MFTNTLEALEDTFENHRLQRLKQLFHPELQFAHQYLQGNPNPIVPKPPDVTHLSGFIKCDSIVQPTFDADQHLLPQSLLHLFFHKAFQILFEVLNVPASSV